MSLKFIDSLYNPIQFILNLLVDLFEFLDGIDLFFIILLNQNFLLGAHLFYLVASRVNVLQEFGFHVRKGLHFWLGSTSVPRITVVYVLQQQFAVLQDFLLLRDNFV